VAWRLPAIAAALDGMGREAAARIAGIDRQTLLDRVIRYKRVGPAEVSDHWADGRPCRLAEDRQATLNALGLQGPEPDVDGVSNRRPVDLGRIVRERVRADCSESGLGKLLHLSDGQQRPRWCGHETRGDRWSPREASHQRAAGPMPGKRAGFGVASGRRVRCRLPKVRPWWSRTPPPALRDTAPLSSNNHRSDRSRIAIGPLQGNRGAEA